MKVRNPAAKLGGSSSSCRSASCVHTKEPDLANLRAAGRDDTQILPVDLQP